MLPIIASAHRHLHKTAIKDVYGSHTFRQIVLDSEEIAAFLLSNFDTSDLKEMPVAFLSSSNSNYVKLLWGIWLAGGITVPLCPAHPSEELKYFIEDSKSRVLLCDKSHHLKLQALAEDREIFCVEDILKNSSQGTNSALCSSSNSLLPEIDLHRRANILYTSGTTNRPKGVVMTHYQFSGQVEKLVKAWHWSPEDKALNILPLHHTHGLVNVVSCSLFSGAELEMHEGFSAEKVWNLFAEGSLTVFMAVPTVYSKLLQFYEAQSTDIQSKMREGLRNFRLMVSGSAALPISLFEDWKNISGHALLERYGMTEIGMAVSNPYSGERKPGYVGQPLPQVSVRLVDEEMQDVPPETAGQLLVQGEYIFKEYWQNPKATDESFHHGWFCTGDIAIIENSYLKILGRNNIDIIKSGGYKISALEIESILRTHPEIREVAVLGMPDNEWGEIVVACLVANREQQLSLEELKSWASEFLAKYKLPNQLLYLDEIPKNSMGKVSKKDLKQLLLTPAHG